MAIGQINLIQENTASGGINAVERTVLFIGSGASDADKDKLHSINQQTDLDAILGAGNSPLKLNIDAAKLNAGPNFTAWVIPVGSLTIDEAIELAADEPNNIYPEQVALVDHVLTADQVRGIQAATIAAENVYGKYLCVFAAVVGINEASQSWSDYISEVKKLQNNVVADRVALVPQLHGNNLGVVVGRLNNDKYSIGDSPMRVRSGSLVGLGGAPKDNTGTTLNMAHLTELANARFSVPQTYTNFDGIYWADHPLLDAEGGDYQVYENRRVIDYVSRRVRVRMIQKIADRELNSSQSSTKYHEQYFMEPIFEASKGIAIAGVPKPGLVQKPQDGDIVIHWKNANEVELAMVAAPVNSPKKITARIALDLKRLG